MMQLKNLRENITIERVYDCAWSGPVKILLAFSVLEKLLLSLTLGAHAQRGLQQLSCVCVCVCVCESARYYGSTRNHK